MPDEELKAVPDLDQEATEENQEATEENQEATEENQEATEENQEATEENQEATEENQEATEENQDATEENQEADPGPEEAVAEDLPEQDANVEKSDKAKALDNEANIKEFKQNLSKDLTIIDEALTDDEFLERIHTRYVFNRFEKYTKNQVNTVSDFEAIARSKFLQVLIILGLICVSVFFAWSLKFDSQEDYKQLIGYIKINKKLPEGFKGPFSEEIIDIIRNYTHNPELYLDHNDQELSHHHEKKEEINMSKKYPGLITNKQLLLILEEQDLGKVSVRGTEYTEKINLSGLDLRSVDFKYLNKFIQSNMKGVKLMGVYIEDAQFRGAELEGADLSLADLSESSFIRSKINLTKFIETDLTNANFYGAKGELVNFTKSFLAGVNFKEVSIKESQFNLALAFSANFRDAFLLGSSFSEAKLTNANFKGANLTAVDFSGADLTGVNFEEAILHGVNFRGANLRNANLKNAQVQKAFLRDAKELTIEQIDAASDSHRAASLPEWVNKSRLSWEKRF